MLLSVIVSHPVGINWESVGTIIASIIGAVFGAALYVSSRVDKGRDRSEKFFTLQIQAVTNSLINRLGIVEDHLKLQDTTMQRHGEQIARIQGNLDSRPGNTGPVGPAGVKGDAGEPGRGWS